MDSDITESLDGMMKSLTALAADYSIENRLEMLRALTQTLAAGMKAFAEEAARRIEALEAKVNQ